MLRGAPRVHAVWLSSAHRERLRLLINPTADFVAMLRPVKPAAGVSHFRSCFWKSFFAQLTGNPACHYRHVASSSQRENDHEATASFHHPPHYRARNDFEIRG